MIHHDTTTTIHLERSRFCVILKIVKCIIIQMNSRLISWTVNQKNFSSSRRVEIEMKTSETRHM